ncbi:MAG TPA: CHASE2 domain-containing protein, partial [Phycisphaerae bacterium]|nr:CHASE2 domain-containing protein [Phycisphaerae bacterium]
MTILSFHGVLARMFSRHPRIISAIVGMAIMSASLAVVFQTDFGRRLELLTYDLRIRHCNSLPPASPILHVDIDDGALARFGRWPWHRDKLAEIIRLLGELGARKVMVDFLLEEPEAPYLEDLRLSKFEEEDPALQNEVSEANRVYPDLELAAAIRDAGNVILAMHMNIETGGATNGPDGQPPGEKELLQEAKKALMADFTMSEEALATKLGRPSANVARIFARAKTDAAESLVQQMIHDGKMPGAEEVLAKILGANKDALNSDRLAVEKALFTARGMITAGRRWPRFTATATGHIRTETDGVPPCHNLAEAATAVSSVNFLPDIDGTTRRVPIAIHFQDRLVPHMGLEAAAQILDLQLNKITLSAANKMSIPSSKGPGLTIPLDDDGNMLIHWAKTAPRWKQNADFKHITAAKLYELTEARRIIEQNRLRRDFLLADVVAAAKGQVTVSSTSGPAETLHTDNEFRRKVNDHLHLTRRIHMARLKGTNSREFTAWQAQADELARSIAKEQTQAIAAVKLAGEDLAGLTPDELAKDPAAVELSKRIQPALKIIQIDIPAIDEANRKLEASAATTLAALAREVKDKFVFLGFFATAEGDIVPTPIDHRTNGVMCHAHVLNGLLQNRFITPPSSIASVVIALILGGIVSFLTATRPPRFALLATLGLMLGYLLIACYILFQIYGIWLALAAPLISLFVTWAFVTLFRQLTAEREKRLFAKQLSQYTSPIIAAKIAENPDAVAAFKTVTTRDMTIFFSDLAGFTTLSEKEDAETIQRVLNTYLDRMSHVIWAHHGLINKFMG